MKQTPPNGTAEQHVREIRRKTRKQYSSEEKIRIVISGLRGEHSIAELCRREGIAESLYYTWSKEFMEAGKKRLAGDTERQASSGEVKDLRREMGALKELVADLTIENRLLKKIPTGMGETANEVSRFGEARDHPAGRGIPAAGETHAREAGRLALEVLPLVRPVSAVRGCGPGRPPISSGQDLEPGARRSSGPGDRTCP
jgi:transposase